MTTSTMQRPPLMSPRRDHPDLPPRRPAGRWHRLLCGPTIYPAPVAAWYWTVFYYLRVVLSVAFNPFGNGRVLLRWCLLAIPLVLAIATVIAALKEGA